MVLINELTVEQINAALLHLQRSKDEVVGGNKGTTIQNISISNSGGGGGNNVDYSGAIQNLANNIEKNSESIEGVKFDVHNLEETIRNLSDAGISDLSYDNLSHQLTITTENGDTFQAQIIQDIATLSFDPATNELSITTGEQTQTITLPAQAQSDWTQTDSTEPDFIKNKIPIWITSGSADDNMSPVDVVEPGNTRPVTSGGVASAISQIDTLEPYTTVTDANLCIPVLMKEKRYLLGSSALNVPANSGGFIIIASRQYYSSQTWQSVLQIAYQQSTSEILGYAYIRQAWSSNSGATWTWGSWKRITTTADIVDNVTANNMQSVTSNAVARAFEGNPSQILYNDSNARITMRTMGKLALFTIYRKVAGSTSYTIPTANIDNGDFGVATLLTNGGQAVGEAYLSSATSLVVSGSTSGAGELVVFLA